MRRFSVRVGAPNAAAATDACTALTACGLPIVLDTLPTPVNTLPHIAILDDDVDITKLLCHYLVSRGFRATQVHSGRALMALMPIDTPALVLLARVTAVLRRTAPIARRLRAPCRSRVVTGLPFWSRPRDARPDRSTAPSMSRWEDAARSWRPTLRIRKWPSMAAIGCAVTVKSNTEDALEVLGGQGDRRASARLAQRRLQRRLRKVNTSRPPCA